MASDDTAQQLSFDDLARQVRDANRERRHRRRTEVITCAYAAQFEQWAKETVAAALQSASHVSLNQTKVALLDKYYEWRAATPARHQATTGQRGAHRCLQHVLDDAYAAIKAAELSLTPPQLYIPEKPRPERKRRALPEPSPKPPEPEPWGRSLLGLKVTE